MSAKRKNGNYLSESTASFLSELVQNATTENSGLILFFTTIEHGEEFTTTALATKLMMPRSTVYRLIACLEETGFLKKDLNTPPPEEYHMWSKGRRRNWRDENGYQNSIKAIKFKYVQNINWIEARISEMINPLKEERTESRRRLTAAIEEIEKERRGLLREIIGMAEGLFL